VTLLASNDLHQFMVQMFELLFHRFEGGICARLVTCFELCHNYLQGVGCSFGWPGEFAYAACA
jgi:hypothetical protein